MRSRYHGNKMWRSALCCTVFIAALLLAVNSLATAGVAVAETVVGEKSAAIDNNDTDAARQQLLSIPNHAALSHYRPLGLVSGNPRPLPVRAADDGVFADAITYADTMDSYALLIWYHGALRVEKYFAGFDNTLRPETASMHKTVLALLVAAAIDDGFIDSADTAIGHYIPQWRERAEGEITVAQLLTMSSGLQPLSSEGGADSPRMRFFTDGETARDTLLSMALAAPPGSQFVYANTNSQLLVLVLEAATGMPYSDYLSRRLWSRLRADDALLWYFEADGFPRAYASLLARARDWLRVGLLIKNAGCFQNDQIIAEHTLRAMTSPSATNANYGWQLWLGTEFTPRRFYNAQRTGFAVAAAEPFAVKDIVYADGFGGQRVYISRSEDLVIVRIGRKRLDWDDSYLPNRIIESLRGVADVHASAERCR